MMRLATAAMGTRFELLVPDDAEVVGELVIAEINEWHQRLSRFAADSWVAHVNRTAHHEPIRCDDGLWALLSDAQHVCLLSDGAFDITRGDADALVLEDLLRTVAFTRPGVQLDLGGIGKGHAIDCAVTMLRAYGVTSAFVHGGTSSGYGLGLDPTGSEWTVAVGAGVDAPRLRLHDSAYSVSDGYAQPGQHITVPGDDGRVVAPGWAVVTGPSARLADAWSTALVVNPSAVSALPVGYSATVLPPLP